MLKYSVGALSKAAGLRSRQNVRAVSSLGPLGSAFNTKPNFGRLPWSRPATGLFGVEELTTGDGFHSIKERCIRNSLKLVEEACSPGRYALQ